jgi:hypothetical protein
MLTHEAEPMRDGVVVAAKDSSGLSLTHFAGEKGKDLLREMNEVESIVQAEGLGGEGAAAGPAIEPLDAATIAFAWKCPFFAPQKGNLFVAWASFVRTKRGPETHFFRVWAAGETPGHKEHGVEREELPSFSKYDPADCVSVLLG